MTKARDIADFKFENIVDTGTEGTKVATGTTAQRGSTTGQWRYNSTTGFFEGRNASAFSTLEPVPTVASVDTTLIDSAAGGNATIVVTGTNFSSGGTITFVGSSANFDASTTTFNSVTQVTAVAPNASFLNAQEPYKVKFTSSNGVAGESSAGLINVDVAPTWTTAAGSLGTIYDSMRGNTLTVAATDADGDTITYSVQSGSLPAGASLNTSTGAISGFSAVGSDTTSNFTLRATAGGKTVDRAFSIIVKQPVTTTYSYTGGDQSLTVPTGLTSMYVWLWGAGGGSDNSSNRGGAGGFIKGTLAVSAGDYKVVVGQGGLGGGNDSNTTNEVNGYGGGGAGYENPNGGGLSGIFSGSGAVFQSGTNSYNSQSGHWTPVPTDHSRTLVVAGGGGGGDPGSVYGGGAGYPSGANGVPASGRTASTGGSQSAGGNYGGGLLVGGDGNSRFGASGRWLGGGGAGYYGGGTSPSNDGGGAGGSNGYSTALTSVTTNTASVTRSPDGQSETNYGSSYAGFGGNGNDTPPSNQGNNTKQGGGYHGRVVISY